MKTPDAYISERVGAATANFWALTWILDPGERARSRAHKEYFMGCLSRHLWGLGTVEDVRLVLMGGNVEIKEASFFDLGMQDSICRSVRLVYQLYQKLLYPASPQVL